MTKQDEQFDLLLEALGIPNVGSICSEVVISIPLGGPATVTCSYRVHDRDVVVPKTFELVCTEPCTTRDDSKAGYSTAKVV